MQRRISDFYPEIKDCYYISDDDKVWNSITGNRISFKIETDGYVRISLMKKEGGTKYLQYHRLKMMAFKPVDNMDMLQINHIDGNKQNNSFSNLEWVTSQENLNHALRTGLRDLSFLNGQGTNLAKYTEEDAKIVIKLLQTQEYTDKEISLLTGYPVRSFISKIRRRETWKYLTNDISTVLGKPERSTFNKIKGSTTIS